jgi:hypothetical protein
MLGIPAKLKVKMKMERREKKLQSKMQWMNVYLGLLQG